MKLLIKIIEYLEVLWKTRKREMIFALLLILGLYYLGITVVIATFLTQSVTWGKNLPGFSQVIFLIEQIEKVFGISQKWILLGTLPISCIISVGFFWAAWKWKVRRN